MRVTLNVILNLKLYKLYTRSILITFSDERQFQSFHRPDQPFVAIYRFMMIRLIILDNGKVKYSRTSFIHEFIGTGHYSNTRFFQITEIPQCDVFSFLKFIYRYHSS
ncbi:hypothetical protein ACOME3_008091 [Neoechinorhynchus agilis]